MRALPVIALAAALGGIAAVSARTLARLDRPADPDAARFDAADRALAYRVTADAGPAFRIPVGGGAIRIASHAVVDGPFDPARTVRYGLALTARVGDQVVWRDEIHLTARQSKARWDGARWLEQAAFTADGVELTDERIVLLSPPAPPGAILTVTLRGDVPEAVIRVFHEDDRPPARRRLVGDALDDVERWSLVRAATYVPWELLDDAERDHRLARRWRRLIALGERGVDFDVRPIFVTAFRAPPPPAKERAPDGLAVTRARGAAINVRGPARLELAVAGAHPGSALDVVVVGADAGPWRLALDDADARLALEVPAGPATVELTTDAAAPVRVAVRGPDAAALRAPDDDAPPAPGELAPHVTRSPRAIAGPDAPVEVLAHAAARAPLLGRIVRIDAAVVLPAGPAPGDGDDATVATLRLVHLDAAGAVVGDERRTIGGPPARFDELRLPGGARRVTDATTLRVIAPPRAARLEITADREVAVRLSRLVGGAPALAAPYDAAAVPDHRWRHAPLATRAWLPMLPANRAALAAGGRLAELHAQVRLEPTGDGERLAGGAGAVALAALEPVGAPERQRVHEPVAAVDAARVLATWPAGAWTRLEPGRARALAFAAAAPRRPRLQWEVAADALGAELVVEVDGAVVVRRAVVTTRGALDLPRLAPGTREVRVIAPPGAGLLIDRPPVGDPRGLVRERTVYPLTRDGLRVRVRKRGGRDAHVHAIVYAAEPGAIADAVRIVVSGGAPRRRSAVVDRISVAERRADLPPARAATPARLVDLGGASAGRARTVSIGLLDDLVDGVHVVHVASLTSRELWVRFVTTERPASAVGAVQWSIPREEDPDVE